MSLLASAIGIILGSVYFILGDNRVVLVALITLVISAIALTSLRHRYKEIMSCLLMFLVVFLNYNIRSEYLEFKAFTKQSVQETLRTKKIEILTSLPIKVITKTRDKFYQSDYIVEQEDSNPLINYFLPKRFLITAPSVLGLESGDYIKLDEKITLNKLDYFERKIYRKDKVYYKSSKTKVEYIGKESNWIKDLQDKVSAYYYKTLSEENYQITLNLLFGSRAFKLEPEFSKQIRRLGLGHFFAASGFHLVVLSFAINWILGLLRLGRRSKS
ncbi:MAG: ComEC/Rec2 family competence protein, partial [Candidatus Caenarcaniphilales bacterium]|nr:ComEC/Rec2 family competence protein [Candidatus Caenarcaniphilales bacterium]